MYLRARELTQRFSYLYNVVNQFIALYIPKIYMCWDQNYFFISNLRDSV